MDGLSLDRRSERGRRFAEELIDRATDAARTWDQSRLGPARLGIGTLTDDRLARLVRGAFLPAAGASGPEFTLAVARHGERRLPSTDWARPWTETGRVVPAELTYPLRVFLDRQVGIAYAFDPRSRRAAVWIRRERELDLRSFITPFRVLLSWMADTFDAEVVHASAAVVDGRGLLLSGASGSGKSTLAIGLGLAGHAMISDDCVLVHDSTAHAVFARAKLDEAAVRLVDGHDLLLQNLPRTPRAKGFVQVDQLGSGFAAEHALHAWGFPALAQQPGHYRVTPRRAYRLLATDSMREVFGGSTRNRLRLARSVRQHPSHRLLLGPSMAENIEVVRSAIDEDKEA
jgi:hypothetical protein